MFKLHAIQAEFGDSFLIESGSNAHPRFVLIDGGPGGVYEDHLRRVLEPLGNDGRNLDLVVLSHVDTDHVAGLLAFFAELRDQQAGGGTPFIRVEQLWHNSFDRAVDPNGEIVPRFTAAIEVASGQAAGVMSNSEIAVQGIAEGNTLRVLAAQLGIPLNSTLAGKVITTDTAQNPVTCGDLKIRIVGPTPANLEALREQWIRWLDEHEDEIISGGPLVLANSDRSVPNLSSISFVVTANDRTILFTGDARSDHILDGLRLTGFTNDNDEAHFDVIKLPHHGSDRNITRAFFRKVTAEKYVVSANGKDGNPDLATLIWLVESAKQAGRIVEIITTNDTPSTQKLIQEYPTAEFGYSLRTLLPDENSIVVDLA